MKARLLMTAALLSLTAPVCVGQATVFVVNNSTTLITNCFTRAPLSNAAYVQLYFTPDLSAVSNQAALASVVAAGSPKLVPGAVSPSWHGRFVPGTVTLPGVSPGSQIVAQLKMWETNYQTFGQAAANGGMVAESLPWLQATGGGLLPTPMIVSRWGLRPFPYPQCEPLRVPLELERIGANAIRVNWPVGKPPNLQVNDGMSTNWLPLTTGVFVQDHWEFQVNATNGVQFFRLAE